MAEFHEWPDFDIREVGHGDDNSDVDSSFQGVISIEGLDKDWTESPHPRIKEGQRVRLTLLILVVALISAFISVSLIQVVWKDDFILLNTIWPSMEKAFLLVGGILLGKQGR